MSVFLTSASVAGPSFCILFTERGLLLSVRTSLNNNTSVSTPLKTVFQTDSPKPRCDCLTLFQPFSRSLRAPSGQNQFEKPLQLLKYCTYSSFSSRIGAWTFGIVDRLRSEIRLKSDFRLSRMLDV